MKFLKKNNKLFKKNGRLVKTNDPAKCPCCGGTPPPDCSCIPASVTVRFTAACAAGLPIDPEYVVPLVDQGGGSYSGAHPSGSVVAGASACVGGKWSVNFGTNLFNPATGPCVVGTVQNLACGETWTGDIGGGDQATLTLNGTPPAPLAHNPLP